MMELLLPLRETSSGHGFAFALASLDRQGGKREEREKEEEERGERRRGSTIKPLTKKKNISLISILWRLYVHQCAPPSSVPLVALQLVAWSKTTF
jgi:hypothetical protein